MARGFLLLGRQLLGDAVLRKGGDPQLISYIRLSNVRGMGFPSFLFC